jgi:gluconokinase
MIDYCIGIDIGTGSTKALAVDFKGHVLASTQFHYPTLTPSPGTCEQEPELIWQAFVSCVRGIVTRIESSPAAIVLSSAMHSVIPVDEKGSPLHNMIIWSDNRSAEVAQRIKQSEAGETLYRETGTPIHAMSPLAKITWLKETNEILFNATAKFISIKEYIWFRLFNAFEVDYSIASATGLMDITKLKWNDSALLTSGLTTKHLSSLVSTAYKRNDILPECSRSLGIPNQTTVVMGASDGCMANLGSFATQPGVAALTIGTSGAVRVACKFPTYNFESMTFNYHLDEETIISGGPSNNGGAALKWFIESFLGRPMATAADYNDVLKTLSNTAPGADELIFLPYLFGERAPIWNSDSCGVFFGIRNKHSQAHFTRAVIEGISMALYDIAEHMTREGQPIEQINVSGGFVRSTEWLQILANIFNKKICLVNADDASAMGAAYLGLKTLKVIANYSDIKPATVKEILPQQEYVAIYEDKFKIYRQLYKNVKPLM